MPSVSGRSSPLPSFAAPRDVSSVSLFAALSALAQPTDSTTVVEKNDALSNRARSRSISGREWWITRRFWDVFAPLVLVRGSSSHGSSSGRGSSGGSAGRNGVSSSLIVPGTSSLVGGGGGAAGAAGVKAPTITSTARTLTIPVLKILHPAREAGRTLHRRDGRTNHAYGTTVYSTRRVVIAVAGTGLTFLVVFLFFFALFRPLLPSRRSLPFAGEPNTCILSTDEIQRVWLWEIASGRYPSRKKPPVDLRGIRNALGKQDKHTLAAQDGSTDAGRAAGANGIAGTIKVENPGVPRKSELEERKERLLRDAELRRVALLTKVMTAKSGSKATTLLPAILASSATVDVDLVPVGPPRSYLPILPRPSHRPSPSTLPPSSYAPRPRPHSVLDLDAVMDHCDFSEGRYVRDCLEVLRMNAGMDTGLRRGDANAKWKMSFLQADFLDGVVGRRERGNERHERSRNELIAAQGNMTSLMSSSKFVKLLAERQQLTLEAILPSSSISDNFESAESDSDSSTSTSSSSTSGTQRRYVPHHSHPTADPGCDPDYPRIFHIFWAGPFTDKPYSAAMSFLYTQRLGLEKPIGSRDAATTAPASSSSSFATSADDSSTNGVELLCRPQLWVWINPGPASSKPDPLARLTMMKELSANPWSKPLLHSRFQESIKFKLWNTTEQLDSVSEMKGWREMRLFNSGGVKYGNVAEKSSTTTTESATASSTSTADSEAAAAASTLSADIPAGRFGDDSAEQALSNDAAGLAAPIAHTGTLSADPLASTSTAGPAAPTKAKDELFERIGSTSSKGYDRLSVVLSDMARFVLTHRFGGVYLDADTILLRDWEELWGWHGSFAYRWSRLEVYNTAVLKMQRGSAIGNLIFKTAVANGLDFHPMTISRYTSDANVEGLLLRLPDALFDPAWLNTEYYQRDRPPFPYFKRFEDFFETPKDSSAAPISLGFDGFFKGSFSYHFHNFWWIPFDATRNFPDLGPRFAAGERIARGRLHAAKLASLPRSHHAPTHLTPGSPPPPAKVIEALKASKQMMGLDGDATFGAKWGDDEDRDFAELDWSKESVEEDERDLSWATVLKRTFESYIRGERPNMYGEWIDFERE